MSFLQQIFGFSFCDLRQTALSVSHDKDAVESQGASRKGFAQTPNERKMFWKILIYSFTGIDKVKAVKAFSTLFACRAANNE
jgi:hypothetical protein